MDFIMKKDKKIISIKYEEGGDLLNNIEKQKINILKKKK